jgi:copper resistance protein B
MAGSAALLVSGVASAQEFSGEVDLLELHTDFDDVNVVVDATADLRQDSRGLVLKVAGNGDLGPSMDDVEVQALFLQQVGPSTALMGGARYDFRPGRNLAYASAAVTHDFADWISGEAFAYVSEDGDVTGSSEAVAAFELGSGLELEPRVEVSWSAQDVAQEGFAAGLTELSASVRLRRELMPNVNAYVGVIHDRLLSDTREMARAAGDSLQVTRGLVGLGLQF